MSRRPRAAQPVVTVDHHLSAERVDACELELMDRDDEATQMRYAEALAEWADADGYGLEVVWEVCTTAALGVPFDRARYRELTTLSGGEQKRLVLEFLLRGPDAVLLLDEPDNFLDVPGKAWLEQRINESQKTILFVSHDRELLDNTATRVVTVEPGQTLWDIASASTPAGGDVRSTMAHLESLNHLDSAGLQIGQRLRIPR